MLTWRVFAETVTYKSNKVVTCTLANKLYASKRSREIKGYSYVVYILYVSTQSNIYNNATKVLSYGYSPGYIL